MQPIRPIPHTALRALSFLTGRFRGQEVVYAPNEPTVQRDVFIETLWEAGERYLRYDMLFLGSPANYESLFGVIGFDDLENRYRMWAFSRQFPEPYVLTGAFEGERLVLEGDRCWTPWGIQRLRYTAAPTSEIGFCFTGHFWTPDGWVLFCESRLVAVLED